MNKRGQGLPMNTIIIIILVLFVLAGVGIYFFSQFSTGQAGTNSAQCIQLCESMKAQMSSDDSITWASLSDSQTRTNFCAGNCYDSVNCKLRVEDKDPQTEWETVYETASGGDNHC